MGASISQTQNLERVKIIRELLMSHLSPTELIVTDESDAHIGHPGAQSGKGHFSITIGGPEFKDKSLVECHRLIYSALGDVLNKEIHALQIRIKK